MKNCVQNYSNNNNYMSVFDAFDEFFRPSYRSVASEMRADIKETESDYELSLAMPGFDKSEIDVSLDKGYLTVSAKKEEKTEDEKYLRREIKQSMSRSFYVGDNLKSENVKAKYENGILLLTIPKDVPEEKTSHSIAID